MIGQMLSKYRILGKLGEGGMGVVWKALDTQLEREVAIKVLPEQFAEDPERLARFEREARMLAALNHRNIASIYGLEVAETSTGSVRFLVMELVEGEDLARRLERGPLPVDEAIDVAHQLARALESAHEKGVLHRDLKPANVQITDDGRIKVLDFGLAKAFETDPVAQVSPTMSPTLTSANTRAGVILGTAAYMSPEQARGRPLDKRSDIWSFGALLYECLTGKSPFRGETVTDTIASIVKSQPDWAKLPTETPPRILELLQRCLEKDVRNRLRDIGDARLELQRSRAGQESFTDSGSLVSGAATAVAEKPRRASMLWLVAAMLIGPAAAVGLWIAFSGSGATAPGDGGVVRLSIDVPSELRVNGWQLSPDGRTIGYIASPREAPDDADTNVNKLYLRSLDALDAREVEGSEGVGAWTFSPDGRWLALQVLVALRSSKSRLVKVPVDGSAPPLVLVDWSDEWWGSPIWLPDGDLMVQTSGFKSLVRIPSGGGAPGAPVKIVPQGFEGNFGMSVHHSAALPDGVHVLGDVVTYSPRGFDQSVGVLNVKTGEARLLIENASSAHWSPTGHLVFSRGDAVLAAPFDLDRVDLAGDTVAIEAGHRARAIYNDTYFDLSADGTLLHFPGGVYGDKRQIVFLDNEGVVVPWSDELLYYEGGLAVSADGRRMAVSICNNEGLYDIWVSGMKRPRLNRFVHEPGWDCVPSRWTPDGESLIYQCNNTDQNNLYVRGIDETAPRPLVMDDTPAAHWANSFLPDGLTVVLTHFTGESLSLARLSLDGAGDETAAPTLWLEDAGGGKVSPDGRWLAYGSDSSGRWQVYIRPLREDGTLGREVQVTTDGGGGLWWYPDRKTSPLRLRYWKGERAYAVDITTEPALEVSTPKLVVDRSDLASKVEMSDALPDGRHLAVLKAENEATPGRLSVVLNWSEELKRRMRSGR